MGMNMAFQLKPDYKILLPFHNKRKSFLLVMKSHLLPAVPGDTSGEALVLFLWSNLAKAGALHTSKKLKSIESRYDIPEDS